MFIDNKFIKYNTNNNKQNNINYIIQILNKHDCYLYLPLSGIYNMYVYKGAGAAKGQVVHFFEKGTRTFKKGTFLPNCF